MFRSLCIYFTFKKCLLPPSLQVNYKDHQTNIDVRFTNIKPKYNLQVSATLKGEKKVVFFRNSITHGPSSCFGCGSFKRGFR